MGCRLCEKYDFGRVLITPVLGNTLISLAAGNTRPAMHERFKYCPECGKELTEEDFKSKEPEMCRVERYADQSGLMSAT